MFAESHVRLVLCHELVVAHLHGASHGRAIIITSLVPGYKRQLLAACLRDLDRLFLGGIGHADSGLLGPQDRENELIGRVKVSANARIEDDPRATIIKSIKHWAVQIRERLEQVLRRDLPRVRLAVVSQVERL